QGEESGMTNPKFTPIDKYRDVESLNAYRKLKEQEMDNASVMDILGSKSRKNGSRPIKRNKKRKADFTSWEATKKIPENYENINVESALEDKGSIFYTYQKLISLRHEMDHFTYGSVVPHLMKDYALFAYERVYNGETITVIANFRDETIPYPEGLDTAGDTLISNYGDRAEELRPFEALMLHRQTK